MVFFLCSFRLADRPPTSSLFPYTTLFRSNGFAAGRYHLHYRDEKKQRQLRFSQYPNLVLSLTGSGFGYCENRDRKSTRLNSSHVAISYAVFCLKKKKTQPLHSRSNHHSQI